MTSMVSGTLKTNTDLTQILTSLFPCGSITGAPKLNTMKYIKQLESSPRGIYCGAIGLLLPTEDDKMIFNIPIRTIEYNMDKRFMESEQVLQLILSQKMK
ncbi:Para-aminobenzoate synthetase component I [Staphylococcus aureus]|uniref:Para-aminobenzoate synthetase component I n=1 Tax=Staphylococcus aureus TaxID=1280 RepID=A0A380DNF0_STAAU|nr:Para-aminobenzoate synthetase component I [Staphylococcus aureus]